MDVKRTGQRAQAHAAKAVAALCCARHVDRHACPGDPTHSDSRRDVMSTHRLFCSTWHAKGLFFGCLMVIAVNTATAVSVGPVEPKDAAPSAGTIVVAQYNPCPNNKCP